MAEFHKRLTLRPSKRGNKALYKINTKGIMPNDELSLLIQHETSKHVKMIILLGKDLHNNDKVYVQGIEWGDKFRYKVLGVSGHYKLRFRLRFKPDKEKKGTKTGKKNS
jgi:hypothetical protein